MIKFRPAQCLALLLAACLSAALAQQVQPSDPAASVPAQRYQSPISSLRPMVQATVAPWRQSNDTVLQRGGWKAYAKAAQAPDDAPSLASGPSAPEAVAAKEPGSASASAAAPVSASQPAPQGQSPQGTEQHMHHHHHMSKHQGARP
jgi:hypothetical protein